VFLCFSRLSFQKTDNIKNFPISDILITRIDIFFYNHIIFNISALLCYKILHNLKEYMKKELRKTGELNIVLYFNLDFFY